VLFADLKGSMGLLADRDPEEARKLLDPVLERMMESVHRYEGTVNQVMGDGIMALFGATVAHEDHSVRACYAALRMQELVQAYADETFRSHGITVRIRVGLNSGEVVVRSIRSDLRVDYSAVGQTTHLAARMEQLASPGTIWMTARTALITRSRWPRPSRVSVAYRSHRANTTLRSRRSIVRTSSSARGSFNRGRSSDASEMPSRFRGACERVGSFWKKSCGRRPP